MPPKTVAIHQPNYLPWKGFFDFIRSVDELMIYDTVQYTKNDWRNRNRIKTAQGLRWLTIPVRRLSLSQKIYETCSLHLHWPRKHWYSIAQAYSRAPYFQLYSTRLEEMYQNIHTHNLVAINDMFIHQICAWLQIDTPICYAHQYEVSGSRTQRLIQLCKAMGGTRYLSGPTARAYIDEEAFAAAGIEVVWMDYAGYPVYEQLHGPFVHEVSVLDLLFHTGPHASRYLDRVPVKQALP